MAINREDIPLGTENIRGHEEGAIDLAHPTKTTRNKNVKLVPINKDPPYAQVPYTENKEAEKYIEKIRKDKAKKADEPTTASVPAGSDLPQTIAQADPKAIAQSLMSMFSMLAMVAGTMSSNSPASINVTNTNALTGALVILANRFGFEKIITQFDKLLENDGINKINSEFQQMVKDALANLIRKAIENGSVNKIPETPVPIIVYGSVVPTPLYLLEKVPDLYIQQYYAEGADPHPGYIEWHKPSTDTSTNPAIIYTKRTENQPPYPSSDDEILGTAEQNLANELTPYVSQDATSGTPKVLTADVLNTALTNSKNYIQNSGMNASLGKNSSTNFMNLLTQLLGIVAVAINITKSVYLPKTVLNQPSVNNSLQQFSKNIAMLKKMKSQSTGAFRPAGFGIPGLSNLSGLGNIGSVMSGLQGFNSSSGVSTAVNLVKKIGVM